MGEGPSPLGFTRRQFVGRGGALAGALGLVSLGWPAGRSIAAQPVSSRLSPARAASYAALVDALVLAPEAGVADPGQSRAAMNAWYGSAPVATRAYIDAVLDSLDAGAPRSFRRLPAAARLGRLRRWTHRADHPVASAAVLLGAPVVDPDTDTPAPSLDYLRP